MNYVILTGASRGLGEAIAHKLLHEKMVLISVSRKPNEHIIQEAKKKGAIVHTILFDLQSIHDIHSLAEQIFSHIDLSRVDSISLINNAGIVAPTKPIARAEHEDIIENVHINLLAPMLLTSEFLKRTKDLAIEKRIINISSGAGKNPIFGWGAYCTSKAGVDMFTRCIAVEEEQNEHPAKIISFAPGVVDTDMQAEIRSSSKEDFVDVERFLALKEEGQLLSPDYVADAVIDLLTTKQFEQGGIVRINQK
ncbi:(S)-benzoin forming benzil reductase [Bacillus sp. 165]|uniref:(S)-benzoin forming benzil reductase n=1 Tax=Bacillus sp. 165 TaxID=1529117 RepID=UPI001ADA7D76|nr:(S)-benzoin forming benzil reductase [Bacillus sp. 165]MBO9129122.1 (S)-benzoin forming benzil reductase [Bacillus sp. 165]